MKIDNKKCFFCIGNHICGPTVTPRMSMCINFRKSLEKLNPTHNSCKPKSTKVSSGGQADWH